jgi:eukaryotic-like serine/threonine-protein kinase
MPASRNVPEPCEGVTPARWQQVKNLLAQALEVSPSDRPAFLASICAGDSALRSEIESLLEAGDRAAQGFLENPAVVDLGGISAEPRGSWIGRRIGPYQILQQIGVGGMGEVYSAFRADDQYRKEVAIKLVRGGWDSQAVIARFKNERQFLASLDHANIARLLDGGTTEDGVPYFVMDLIEGRPITEYCERHQLPTSGRLRLFLEVCSAVQYAHQRLIIHRDIKPGNILVTEEGIPKLLDFGIAKMVDANTVPATAEPTATLFRALTPGYASPEQVNGEVITTASDVFSLGVVLYELLTGRNPYCRSDSTPQQVARAVCEEEPAKPSTAVRRSAQADLRYKRQASGVLIAPEKLSKTLRGDLDNIILMALRKEPQRRYASVEQFATDIRRHLDNLPVIARKDTAKYRASKFFARHKTGVIAATLVVLTLLIALAVTLHEARIARLQRARAEARFNDVRKLANSFMFDFDKAIENIPGTTHAREMLIKTALQYLDSLARESRGDPSLQDELASAYENVGDIQGALMQQNVGNTSGALESHRKALAIRQSLVAADRGNRAARRKLAIAYGAIGTLLGQENDFAGALENDGKATAIYEALSADNPSDPGGIWDRAEIHMQTAFHLSLKGDFAAAVDQHRQAIAMFKTLAAAKPNDQGVKLDLAHAYRLASFALRKTGDNKGALELIQEGIPISQRIVQDAPNNVRAKLDLAYGYLQLATIEESMGDLQGALESWLKAHEIGEAANKADPNDTRAKLLLGDSYAYVNLLQIKLGRSSSMTGLLKSLEIRRQLLAANPNNGGRKEAVANSYSMLGDAEGVLAFKGARTAQLQHCRAAQSWYKQALEIYTALRSHGALRGEDASEPDAIAKALAKCDAALAGATGHAQPSGATPARSVQH